MIPKRAILFAAAGIAVALLLVFDFAARAGTRDAAPAFLAGHRSSAVSRAVSSGSQANGRVVFERKGNCATCHGRNGRGTPLAPDLTDGEWLHIGGTLEEIIGVVRSGVPKPLKFPAPMPPMGGARLSDDEIDAVARYVASLRPTPDARP